MKDIKVKPIRTNYCRL